MRVEDTDGAVYRFHDVAVAHAETLIGWLDAELIAVVGDARVNVAETVEALEAEALKRNDEIAWDAGFWRRKRGTGVRSGGICDAAETRGFFAGSTPSTSG